MTKNWIQNRAQVENSKHRGTVLELIQSAFNTIDTETVIRNSIQLNGNILSIKDQQFDIHSYEHIYVVGFGKASCKGAYALEQVLGNLIREGIAIGLAPVACEYIQTYGGTHPKPSIENVELSEKILELSKNITEKDLVITIVSGGGSALLCWPMSECKQSQQLYQEFLATDGSILELNTVRKHISQIKGGGLAKYLYPATVIGLIFSDVPGNHYELIASGPTYKDTSTIADAQKILDKYHLTNFTLSETPKEDIYFEKVTNIPLISNLNVLEAMAERAHKLGLQVKTLSSELYNTPESVAKQFQQAQEDGLIVLGAGEPNVVVTVPNGKGGRCQRLGMIMLPLLQDGDVFAAIASDGLDNGKYAGIIEDAQTLKSMKDADLEYTDYLQRFDSEGFYEKLGHEQLLTGPTEANVSDFFIYYRP